MKCKQGCRGGVANQDQFQACAHSSYPRCCVPSTDRDRRSRRRGGVSSADQRIEKKKKEPIEGPCWLERSPRFCWSVAWPWRSFGARSPKVSSRIRNSATSTSPAWTAKRRRSFARMGSCSGTTTLRRSCATSRPTCLAGTELCFVSCSIFLSSVEFSSNFSNHRRNHSKGVRYNERFAVIFGEEEAAREWMIREMEYRSRHDWRAWNLCEAPWWKLRVPIARIFRSHCLFFEKFLRGSNRENFRRFPRREGIDIKMEFGSRVRRMTIRFRGGCDKL